MTEQSSGVTCSGMGFWKETERAFIGFLKTSLVNR